MATWRKVEGALEMIRKLQAEPSTKKSKIVDPELAVLLDYVREYYNDEVTSLFTLTFLREPRYCV